MGYYFQTWKKFATFEGRARRAEYWQFFVLNFVFSFVIGIACGVLKIPYVNALFTVATLIPSIAVGVRRMHDTGRSGWHMIIPIYNFVLALTAGVPGDNHYGPDPKGDGKPKVQNLHEHQHDHQKGKQAA